jgi:hypothetical protein
LENPKRKRRKEMHAERRDEWLEEVAKTCSVTLAVLNKKAENAGYISEADQMMSDLCMGYLYLLNVCDSEGVLLQNSTIKTITQNTLH